MSFELNLQNEYVLDSSVRYSSVEGILLFLVKTTKRIVSTSSTLKIHDDLQSPVVYPLFLFLFLSTKCMKSKD